MLLRAAAKINLHLRVAPPDESGYHPLMSWMCTVGLFDTLTIERAEGGEQLELAGANRGADDALVHLECDDPSLPRDKTNLAVRAAMAVIEALRSEQQSPGQSWPHNPTLLRIRLEKRIPVGGGLGGGSADAARVLLGLNRLLDLNWPMDRIRAIAATLGSDVPFFLEGPSSVVSGRGQVVRPLPPPRPRWVVLVLPGYGIPTRDVYRMFDEMRLGDRRAVDAQPDWNQWAELSAGPLMQRLINDLEPAAFALCPQLATLRQQIEQALGRPVRMSGSGSSLFTLFDKFDEAQDAVARITNSWPVRALATTVAPEPDDDLADRSD
ncbi:4-(cytidine 5'-diphospho)-2-C-methyl-D-erythritol kinase [Fontivita pretiosa]|uniref:4-(cytidine 5'-diphospho)-2-C-methyl-D-erythritol kinase n=1 Tax=Fontivita pretiosa TaxID=2989684 RepID=UPI003D16CEF3